MKNKSLTPLSHALCSVILLIWIAFLLPAQSAESLELPPANNRGVMGLRWGNTIRQVEEGMRRNKAKREGKAETLPQSQIAYLYSGTFFELDGNASLVLHRGKLWRVLFTFPEKSKAHPFLLQALMEQYGKGEQQDGEQFWLAGSTRITLSQKENRTYLGWADNYLLQSLKETQDPDVPEKNSTDTEESAPSVAVYQHKIPYQQWTKGAGLDAPFTKGNQTFFGLKWGLPSKQSHVLMAARNRSVFRGKWDTPSGEMWEYSGRMQNKYAKLNLFFTQDELRRLELIFPNNTLPVEKLFLTLLENDLSPPLMRDGTRIWYYGPTAIVRQEQKNGSVQYSFSPLTR